MGLNIEFHYAPSNSNANKFDCKEMFVNYMFIGCFFYVSEHEKDCNCMYQKEIVVNVTTPQNWAVHNAQNLNENRLARRIVYYTTHTKYQMENECK